jgi:short-subunit dehydrogenase involved in D-alanine esterification of teichoic acids
MDLQLKGKAAIVTGGTAGIGLAIARALSEEGVEVTIPGRTRKKLQEALSSLPGMPAESKQTSEQQREPLSSSSRRERRTF